MPRDRRAASGRAALPVPGPGSDPGFRSLRTSARCPPEKTRRRLIRRFVRAVVAAVLLTVFGCAAAANAGEPVPKGERQFAIAITTPAVERGQDFFAVCETAVDLAIATGIDLPGEIAIAWSTAERRSLFGNIRFEDDGNERAIGIVRRKRLPVIITFVIFETAASRIPADLRALNYDDPKLLRRLHQYIDWVYALTRDLDVRAVVFGNEFDVHLALEAARNRDRWGELERMIASVRAHVRSLPRWRNTPFALEATVDGLIGESRDRLRRLNEYADVIGASYYPLAENGVLEPRVVGDHVARLLDEYPTKDVHFYAIPAARPLAAVPNSSVGLSRNLFSCGIGTHTASAY